jgi:hypothetical protein
MKFQDISIINNYCILLIFTWLYELKMIFVRQQSDCFMFYL